MDAFECFLNLGSINGSGSPQFRISEELLKTHLAIFGGTRYGKSKLLELICRELILNRRGFAFIDPHSDTADDLLGFIAAHSKEFPLIKSKVQFLKPVEMPFSFDPFRYHPGGDDSDFGYRCWLHTKIKDITKIIVRQQGETEDEAQKMVRLRRWLYNVLYAVGVRHDASGKHLPLKDVFILLNPQDPEFPAKYKQVRLLLSDEVRADFEKLRRTKEAKKQEDWVESTLNRLRDILSPLVKLIFNLESPSIDFHQIIARGEIILASLGKTPRFHDDEALAIAGLIIREISEAIRTVDREKRSQFYLFIDEAHNFLGDDLIRLLKESAKYKLSFGLAVQGLDNLQKGQVDMVPAVLGQCGIRITFRQQFHEHAETLAKSLCYTMLDFTELLHEVDRHDGYDFIVTQSESFGDGVTDSVQYGIGKSWQTSESESWGEGITDSESESVGIGETEGTTISDGTSHTDQTGTTDQVGQSKGVAISDGKTVGESSHLSHGTSEQTGHSVGVTASGTLSAQQTHGDGTNYSDARSHGESAQEGTNKLKAIGHSQHEDSQTRNENQSTALSSSNGTTTNESNTSGMTTSDSKTVGQTVSSGTTETNSNNQGSNQSVSQGISTSKSQSLSTSAQEGNSHADASSSADSVSKSVAKSKSLTRSQMRGRSRSLSRTFSRGNSNSYGGSETKTEGQSTSKNQTVTFQTTPLSRIRVEIQRTGRLECSVQDQFAKHTATISRLLKQECLVAIAAFNTAFILRVAHVEHPFEESLMSERFQRLAIDRLKKEIYSKPHYFNVDEKSQLPSKGGEHEPPPLDENSPLL